MYVSKHFSHSRFEAHETLMKASSGWVGGIGKDSRIKSGKQELFSLMLD
jgi:hypothetical protein